MTELKPCSFCGGKASFIPDMDLVHVRCTQCRLTIGIYTPERATEIWNNRPIEDALQKRVEKLEKENKLLAHEVEMADKIIEESHKK